MTTGRPHSNAAQPDRIAIIGVSGRYPGGADSPELLWSILKRGVDAVGEAKGDRWDLGWHHPDPQRPGRVYTKAGGFLDRIDGFDAEFFGLSPREARQVDPQQRLLLELAWEAHENAGIAPRSRAGADTGVFVGISSNDYASLVGPEWPDAYSNTGSSFSIAANRISYIFDFHGPSVAVDTACSSSIVCVHQACVSLLAGECSTALAGGVNILSHIRAWLGFAKASMLSPTGRCRSFDANGDGYVRSEGGGLVLLKPLAAAERDGDRILGVILASGVNSDGRTMGLSMPNGEAQEKLLRKVYSQCAVQAGDVFYVEAHGPGTAVGDPIECGALGRVLGEPRSDGSNCLIGSVKSNIGHLEAASGMAGLTKVLLAFQHREIPANLHFHTPNPKIEFEKWKLQVVTSATPLPSDGKPVVVGLNSFGFGGTNAHLVIQEYRSGGAVSGTALQGTGPDVLMLSGHSEAALQAVARAYLELLRDGPEADWSGICAATATCRTPQRYRLALAAATAGEAIEKLQGYLAGNSPLGVATGNAAGPRAPLAFVYSGNGPQWWGMGRELLAENAVFRAEIEAIDAIFAPLAGWSLLNEMRLPESECRVALTEVAQPLLFALQLGLTQVLRAQGVHASAVLGHSVGEAAAAWACGALTREQATHVIYHRSMQQAKTAGAGRMAALGATPEEARETMHGIGGWLELAATNSAQAVTIAGDPAELDKMVHAMTAAGKFARLLPLNYAFHTKAMDPIREPLLAALQDLVPSPSAVPFVSTVDGAVRPGEELDAEYWYRNVREPVQFHQAVTHLLKAGVTVFLEIGPHPVLKDYVAQSAKSVDAAAVALQTLRRPGSKGPEPESGNLWTAICACHAAGATEFQTLFTRPVPPPALPTYPWQHARHWRGQTILPGVASPTRRDHPLLGHRVASEDGIWENVLDTNQLPWLKDHVVQDSVLFPAAGYIELALAACRLAFGKGNDQLDVENFEILRPLVIPAHGDPLMQISTDAKDGTFGIHSRADQNAEEWTAHVRGRLSRAEKRTAPDQTDLAELSARMPHAVSAERHYADASNRGLDYGPAFQGVGNVLLTAPAAEQREALAEIGLGFLADEGLEGYLAHPSLLDSCIQVLITLIAQNEKRNCCTIPVQVFRVRSFAPLTSSIFCHVIMRQESERSAVADFRVMDTGGNLLLTIDEARCQKVDFRQAAPSPLISEWWRPDPKAQSSAAVAPLPTPSQLLAAAAADVPVIAAENEREEFYRDIQPRLEALAQAYAAQALAALNPGSGRKARLKRDAANLHAKLVQICKTNPDGAVPQPAALWRELFLAYPRCQTELLLLAQAGEQLGAKLRGDESAGPAAGLADTLYDTLFDTAPFATVYNQLARSVVEKMVAAWPADRPMRILEVGGAGGGLAAWILPVLPSGRADYLFTDASEAAVARAEHRFAAHRFARFSTLDPSRDFAEQDLPGGYFDLVIGAHSLRPALPRLHAAMAPGALLLALETRPSHFAELVLGAGGPGKEVAPLSEADLASAGFEDVNSLTDTGSPTAQQCLLIARKSAATPAALPTTYAPRNWMLVFEPGESQVFSRTLADTLTARGQEVAIAVSGAAGIRTDQDAVYISSPSSALSLLETEKQRCLSALQLVQQTPASLTFVTRGAFATGNGQGPLDVAQAPLWGLGRVIGNEHPALNLRLIDLHSVSNAEESARWLADELLRRDGETEVQISAGQRYVNRQRMNTMTGEARNAGVASRTFALDFVAPGGLDSLYLREVVREAPRSHEVEIAVKAAGLNFRDVLWTMGMLPEEAVEQGFSGPTIGMECAGEVLRVGAAVTGVKPGDRVVAFASSCFGSHVTTDAGSVAQIPGGIDYAAAATIPTAFLTAYYAFDYLARLEPGETVLIHGAAGGVGLAAIQIAKLKGAKVIGTAGSARKRRMLEMLGVEHALNSRSLEFADEVMKITGGAGVDVVLNSLAGEAITKSLQCLRPFGRFLEIGKRDLYANSRIGLRPFRNNLSYFGIDADTLIMERAALARSIFHKVMAHFAAGELRPLPFQEVPVSRAAEAFRSMQQSRHVGKLVVSMRLDRHSSLPVVRSGNTIKANATYLVTGGLGGFGLATAEWLAEQGATSLALLGRRGATTEEAVAAMARFEAKGITARAFAVDIADAGALDAVLNTVRGEMAPLTGVIHSAAVIEDAPIMNIGAEQLERVFRPKLIGAWNLHRATLQDELDLFVLYSSSSAVVGNPGQGAYVAANLYLDSLAFHRRALGLPALSIGWGAIKDAGFLTRHEGVAGMLRTRTGLDATPAHEALADLGRLSAVGATRLSVARFDLQRLGQMLPGARVPRFLPIIPKGAAASMQAEETLADLLKKTPEGDRRALILARVREHGARVLGTSAAQINVDQPLADLGLDSLMAVELAGGLERDLGQPVSVMTMLSAGSLAAIAQVLMKMLGVGEESLAAPASSPALETRAMEVGA